MNSIFQGSNDKSDLFVVPGDTVISEKCSSPCHRSPRHAIGLATVEMNQGLFKQMPVQKASPFPEAIFGHFRKRSALIRQGLPAIKIKVDIESVDLPEWTSSQPALHLGTSEVQKLDPVRSDQRTIVKGLCIMDGRKPIDSLQFVDHSVYHRVQTVNLRKAAKGDFNWGLSANIGKPYCPQSCCEIAFINGLLTKPAQFILTLVGATHHHLVNLIKLLITKRPGPNGMNDRHTKPKFNEPGSRGKGDLNNSKSHIQYPPFPCPHSLVPFLLLLLLLSAVTHAAPPQAALDESHRAFLREHCTGCHNAEKQKGKVRLDDIPFVLDDIPTADLWQKVLNTVNSGEMPPEEEPQPADEAKTAFLDALSGTLVTAREVLSDVEGRITMRRLNRREYKNTIRDLLGVAVPAGELPADGGAGTFDTVGSSLFMSSDQFEQYLALGRQAVDEHFARFVAPVPEKEWKLRIEVEGTNQRIRKGLEERTDARRRYLEWTTAVDAVAAKPENAALADRIRAEKKDDPRHLHDEWQRIQGAPAPAAFGFTDAVHAEQMGRRDWEHFVPHHRAYLEHPLTKTGTFLTIDDAYVNSRQIFQLPGDWPPGDYVLRVRIAAMDGLPRERRFVEFGPQDPSGVCTVSSTHEVTGTAAQPQVLEIPLKLTESKTRLFMFRERGSHDSDAAASRLFAEAKQRNGMGPELALWIDWIEVASKAAAALPVGKPQKLRKDPEQWANQYMPIYAKGYAEKYERFQKWCAAIDGAARKPENAEAVAKLRADPRLKTQPHLFYNGFAQIQGAPAPTQFGFRDVDDAQFARSEYTYHYRYYEDYQKLPARDTGTWLMLYSLGRYTGITAPEKWPAGRYTLRIRLAASDESPKERRFIEIGTGKADAADFNVLSSHQVTGTLANPQTLEIPVTINAAGYRNFAIRDKRPNTREAEYAMFREAWDKTGTGPRPCIWIDHVELEGPQAAEPPATTTTIRQRREVELHANAMVGGTYNGYFKQGYAAAKKFLETKQPQKGIADEQEAKFRVRAFEEHGPSFERYLNDPLTKTGAYLTIYNVHTEELITLPPDQPSGWLKTKHEVEEAEPGEYMLRFRIGSVKGTPEERHFVELGSRIKPEEREDFTLMRTFQISGTTDAPQTIEVPVSISAGGPRSFVLREKRDVKLDHEVYTAARKETKVGPPSALWIDWVEWEGPLSRPAAESDSGIPPALSGGETDPRAVLERFAVRAFRGKTPSAAYLDKLTALHDARIAAGDSFDQAIREPLSAILASPGFLYIQEVGTGELGQGNKPSESHSPVPIPLSQAELASRLSYFLWSAPPDETLLEADLTDPGTLAREVDRLIASPKADEFVSGFVHQWLHLDRLDFFQFDTKQFRDFDESAKAAARREVYETFAHLLRHGGSLSRLLKNDEIHVNGLLATYYGIEGVSGDEFRPVKVPAGSPRGGLLGMAAVLAMGSNGERTSPVERGTWVLRYLLHNPPPPAPPNVPQLDRLDGKPVSPRERLVAHMEEAQCAQCHRKIDPIGFGLENFNAAGKWREIDYDPKTKKEWPIDPAGAFHNGPAFKNYFELRDLVAGRSDEFARGFTEALIEYGLGRPYGFTDDALASDIVARAKEEDFAVRAFIQALVVSGTFGKK